MANKRKSPHERTGHLNTTVPGGLIDRLGRAADIDGISVSEANARAIEMYCDAVEGNRIDYLTSKRNEELAKIDTAIARINDIDKRIADLQTIQIDSQRQKEQIEFVLLSPEYKHLLESISNRYAHLMLNREFTEKGTKSIAEDEKIRHKIDCVPTELIIEEAMKIANEKMKNPEWKIAQERRPMK